MGWTKHPDAVSALRGARREAYACIKAAALDVRRELKDPDDITGAELLMHAYYLHDKLQEFSKLNQAVGGDEAVNLQPYIDLVLTVFPKFKWRVHVR